MDSGLPNYSLLLFYTLIRRDRDSASKKVRSVCSLFSLPLWLGRGFFCKIFNPALSANRDTQALLFKIRCKRFCVFHLHCPAIRAEIRLFELCVFGHAQGVVGEQVDLPDAEFMGKLCTLLKALHIIVEPGDNDHP